MRHAFLLFPFHLARTQELGDIHAGRFDHVVVIPDIHGDVEYLIESIALGARMTNYPTMSKERFEDLLISQEAAGDSQGDPSRTIIVQLGDVPSRGPGSKQCFAVLFSLETTLGWKFLSLYGNHELMAFLGKDVPYVNADEYGFFGGVEKRTTEFSSRGSLWREIYGKSHLVARIGGSPRSPVDTLFVHAGIDSSWLSQIGLQVPGDVTRLNKFAQRVLSHPTLADHILSPLSSPLWTRQFETESHSQDWCETELAPILDLFRVSRIIVGHCPLKSKRVQTRCDGRIILTDVKMSRWMVEGGQPMALVMNLREGGGLKSIKAHYIDPSDLSKEWTEDIYTAPMAAPPALLRSKSMPEPAFFDPARIHRKCFSCPVSPMGKD